MAITRQDGSGIRYYYGLSGDTKPTDAPAGSKFHETDTGDVYTYSGSAWFIADADSGGGAGGEVTQGDGDPAAVPWPVDPGSIAAAAAADAIGTDGHRTAALTNTAVAVKASAGRVYGYQVHNPDVATAYWQVYNVAAASVTVGTTTPYKSIGIPAGATAIVALSVPWTLDTAISHAATTTAAGGTAPGAALVANADFK